MHLDFQDRMAIFVDPVDKHSAYYPVVVHFEANRCIVSAKNTESNAVSFNPGQTVAYLDCNNIPTMKNHTYIPDGMLHSMISPEALQKQTKKYIYYHIQQYEVTLMLVIQRTQQMINAHG